MRLRRALVGLLAGSAAVLLAAQLAGAQVVERVLIADPARAAHGLPPGLVVELTSPTDYNRASAGATDGRWIGPTYISRDRSVSGASAIDWTVTFDERQGDADAIANANLKRGFGFRDQRGGLSVPHVVGNRLLGAIPGYYYLMTPGEPDARFEAVLAFPLGANLHAVVRLQLLEPPSDSFVVKEIVSGSTWNRGQALLALSGVRLQGNLPPKIVSAKAAERGRKVKGKVVDRFLDPVVGAQVALERSAGGGWARVARGRTGPTGLYTLRPGRRGTYRVTVNMGGFKAESRPLRAGGR
jgi:Carboxypeptidase regulatory-like domain